MHMRVALAVLVAVLFYSGAVVSGPGPSHLPQPLSGERRRVFLSSPEDPQPGRRTMPAHYWAGNEPEIHVYHRYLKGLGGGYVGVGSDQGLLFLEWMKARLAWLIDYDPEVVIIVRIHMAFIRDAATPKAYVARWSAKARSTSSAFVARAFPNARVRAHYVKVYQKGRGDVFWRLFRVRRTMRRRRIPCFLTHQKSYDYVRRMITAGRIRPMLVNLLDRRGMVGIGRAARKLRVPIRALYLSNAEQYWKSYSVQYRTNVRSQTFDRRSLVLRTVGLGPKRQYAYQLQPARNFVGWLQLPSIKRLGHIKFRKIRRKDEIKFYMMDLPPRSRWRKRAAAKRGAR